MPDPPDVTSMYIPGADKLGHFAAYLVLMIWFGLGNITRKGRLLIASGLVAMGGCIEYLQLWEGWRTFEFEDMAANTAGVSTGLLLTTIGQKRVKSAAITCLVLIALCLLPVSVQAGLFSGVHTTGLIWGKPDLKVTIAKSAGAEGYLDDMLTVINEWNKLLRKVRGAPIMTLVDAPPADITVTVTLGAGASLGYAELKTEFAHSCVLSKVNIVLYTEVYGMAYSHAGMRNIFRHEMAHALGLGHSNDENEQMFPTAGQEVLFRNVDIPPSDCEMKGLSMLYPVQPYCVLPKKVECF